MIILFAIVLIVDRFYQKEFNRFDDLQISPKGSIKDKDSITCHVIHSTRENGNASLNEAIAELQTAETDEDVTAILDRYPKAVRDELQAMGEKESDSVSTEPEPWTGPAVDAVMETFGKSRNEIIAVQRMDILENGVPVDSVEAVITDKEEWYYYRIADGTLSTELPTSRADTTKIDTYDTEIDEYKEPLDRWDYQWQYEFPGFEIVGLNSDVVQLVINGRPWGTWYVQHNSEGYITLMSEPYWNMDSIGISKTTGTFVRTMHGINGEEQYAIAQKGWCE